MDQIQDDPAATTPSADAAPKTDSDAKPADTPSSDPPVSTDPAPKTDD